MKKKYIKPDIMFENFALSSSIAAGCEVIEGNQNYGSCTPVYFGRKPVFTEEASGICKFKVVDGAAGNYSGFEYDGLCYHVPSEERNIFMS